LIDHLQKSDETKWAKWDVPLRKAESDQQDSTEFFGLAPLRKAESDQQDLTEFFDLVVLRKAESDQQDLTEFFDLVVLRKAEFETDFPPIYLIFV
jgi:hypothetical protein